MSTEAAPSQPGLEASSSAAAATEAVPAVAPTSSSAPVATQAPPFGAGLDMRKSDPSSSTDPSSASAARDASSASTAASDASMAAQTITQLASAATDAAAAAAPPPPTTASDAPSQPNASNIPHEAKQADIAGANQPADNDASASQEQQQHQAESSEGPQIQSQQLHQEEPTQSASPPALPRKVEEELKEIYSASAHIANFCVAHLSQVNLPAPNKIRLTIQKALNITSSLSSLMSLPEVALRQLDGDDHGKRASDARLDSARKRQRSSDWDGKDGAQSGRNSIGGAGLGLPLTPNSALRVFPDGSLPTNFISPGMDGDIKTPQYKKRSRAPAPGSCQACGTSETPEWRRGPDGARTLCNACGLHYSKLVRKRQQQEGGQEEPSPSAAQPLVTLEELRASTKIAEAAAAAAAAGGGGASGMTPSASSASLNGTPLKVDRSAAWNTPSKPPRFESTNAGGAEAPRPPPSFTSGNTDATVAIAPELERGNGNNSENKHDGVADAPAAAAAAPPTSVNAAAGGGGSASAMHSSDAAIAPELTREPAASTQEERPMDTE